jgi:hypothetical protein
MIRFLMNDKIKKKKGRKEREEKKYQKNINYTAL